MVHPIIDEYYNYNPYHSRSSKFVQDKGLVTNEKGAVNGSPAMTPGAPIRKISNVSASLRDSLARTLTPSMHTVSVSPALSPASDNIPLRISSPLSDLRNLSLQNLSSRDPSKPQELGNTKKKRKSLSTPDAPPVVQPVDVQEPESPPPRNYGDPMKIAQYFPELN